MHMSVPVLFRATSGRNYVAGSCIRHSHTGHPYSCCHHSPFMPSLCRPQPYLACAHVHAQALASDKRLRRGFSSQPTTPSREIRSARFRAVRAVHTALAVTVWAMSVWTITVQAIHNYIGHNYMSHKYMGYKYIGRDCIGHRCIGHQYIGHNYIHRP